MSNAKPISVTAAHALDDVSDDLRNDIFSALLSGTGIRNIEATLDHELQATGFMANLRAYINHLLRSGECTTFADIMTRIDDKIQHDSQAAAMTNGATNGVNGLNGHTKDDDYDLALPKRVITAGARTVQAELEKVCTITEDDQK